MESDIIVNTSMFAFESAICIKVAVAIVNIIVCIVDKKRSL